MEGTKSVREVVSDDLDFEVWSVKMKTTLTEKGLWDVIEYGIPRDPSKNQKLAATLQVEQLCQWRDLARKDMEALQILQSSLPTSVFKKTISASSAKDLWEMLEHVPVHISLGFCYTHMQYDADMWMIYTSSSNHMTPYENYFMNLDRTRRARVRFMDGSTTMAQGTGDIRILTKGGKKKTIKDVLFVPGLVANSLSVDQLCRNGYEVVTGTEECTIVDQVTGKLFAKTRWEERGFFLRFQENLMAAVKTCDEFDYETWAPATKTTLIEKGLWDVVENGVPSDPSKSPESAEKIKYADLSEWRKLLRKDMEALEILQSSLPDSVFKKTLSVSSAKDVWDLLKKGNEQEHPNLEKKSEEESDAEYEMLLETHGDFTYDDDMWMLCAKGTTNHMTPYAENFTNLDTTHKAKVRLVDGSFLAVQGRGDVKVMMREGKKKTVANVLYVPGFDRNVLSFQQLIRRGYRTVMGPLRCYWEDRKGAEFGVFMCDERGPALRLHLVEANQEPVTYDEDVWQVCRNTYMHRSPYDKVFTSLDTRQKARAVMEDGNVLMVEGKGDVKIVMKGGKEMTIKNVHFIPGITKSVLSVSEMVTQGCSLVKARLSKWIISDKSGAELGETMWDGNDLALRLHIIKKN